MPSAAKHLLGFGKVIAPTGFFAALGNDISIFQHETLPVFPLTGFVFFWIHPIHHPYGVYYRGNHGKNLLPSLAKIERHG
jgi:hypothetical protein